MLLGSAIRCGGGVAVLEGLSQVALGLSVVVAATIFCSIMFSICGHVASKTLEWLEKVWP